ncbi:MAG: Gfo/Idh/MocA family oxidoreductase [Verrucomicrobiota bacterium]
MNRRTFLKTSCLAMAPLVLPSGLLRGQSPSNKITLGFIGMGSQGIRRNLNSFLRLKNTKVLAVSDCHIKRANSAKKVVDKAYENKDCVVYQDFREVINRNDIDAVVISTPDHWHVPMCNMAIEADKDVFCEKPTLTIKEGDELVEKASKKQTVFQWGIEDRYLQKYYYLAGWARSGLIGEISKVTCKLPSVSPFKREEPAPVPKGLDWNLWLGPAPYTDYTPSALDIMHWRLNSDYSGGMLTDWGTHLCDTAQIGIGMEESGPIEVFGESRTLDPKEFHSDAPVDFKVTYRYANGCEMFVSDSAEKIRQVLIEFEGTKGWVRCLGWDGKLEASDPNIMKVRSFGPEANYWQRPPMEQEDFINAVISREKPIYHAEAGNSLCTMLHIGHIALREGRKVGWDPKSKSFTTDKQANESSIIYQRKSRTWD